MSGPSPTWYARDVRTKLGLGWGPIDPEDVCAALAIRVFEEDLGQSKTEAGALVLSLKGRLGIVVNQQTPYSSRKRFTIAHELGHACIPAHADQAKWCAAGDINAYRSDQRIEREANEFAAELLLPERTMRERLQQSSPSVSLFKVLAEEFGTSLTATACRIVALADSTPCAVVLVAGDRVVWTFTSPRFREAADIIHKGDLLPEATLAAATLKGQPPPSGPQPVPASAWLRRGESIGGSLLEEVVPFPNLGQALSFIELPLSEGGVD